MRRKRTLAPSFALGLGPAPQVDMDQRAGGSPAIRPSPGAGSLRVRSPQSGASSPSPRLKRRSDVLGRGAYRSWVCSLHQAGVEKWECGCRRRGAVTTPSPGGDGLVFVNTTPAATRARPVLVHVQDVEEGPGTHRAPEASLARHAAHLRRHPNRLQRLTQGDPGGVRALVLQDHHGPVQTPLRVLVQRTADAMEKMYQAGQVAKSKVVEIKDASYPRLPGRSWAHGGRLLGGPRPCLSRQGASFRSRGGRRTSPPPWRATGRCSSGGSTAPTERWCALSDSGRLPYSERYVGGVTPPAKITRLPAPITRNPSKRA